MLNKFCVGAPLLSALLLCLPAHSNESQAKLAERYEPAVVRVSTMQQGIEIEHGTGFFVSENGLLITNRHVTNTNTNYYTEIQTRDGKKFRDPEIVYCEDKRILDVCLLKIDFKPKSFLPPAERQAKKGSDVMVIGHPLGFEYIFSAGIVSGEYSEKVGERDFVGPDGKSSKEDLLKKYVMITAPISPGSSGAPVFDNQGDLVGMASAGNPNGENLNLAISASDLSAFFQKHKGDKPITAREFRKAVRNSEEQEAKAAEQKVIEPIIKNLDQGGKPDEKFVDTIKLSVAGRDYSFGLLKICDPKTYKIWSPSPTQAQFSCSNLLQGIGVNFYVEKTTPGAIDRYEKLEKNWVQPEPLPIVQAMMKAGTWAAKEKTLTATQKEFLFSVPGKMKCIEEKGKKILYFTQTKSCSGWILNSPYLGGTTYVTFSQRHGDPFLIAYQVTSPGKEAFYYQTGTVTLGSTTYSENGVAAGVAAAGAAVPPKPLDPLPSNQAPAPAEPSKAPETPKSATELFQEYATKAKTSEAKTLLAGIYASEKAFFAEWGIYATDLKAIGFDGYKPVRYGCGFRHSFEMKNPGVPDFDPKRTFAAAGGISAEQLPDNAIVSANSFIAACAGRPGPKGELDVWTLDDKKVMTHVQAGN